MPLLYDLGNVQKLAIKAAKSYRVDYNKARHLANTSDDTTEAEKRFEQLEDSSIESLKRKESAEAKVQRLMRFPWSLSSPQTKIKALEDLILAQANYIYFSEVQIDAQGKPTQASLISAEKRFESQMDSNSDYVRQLFMDTELEALKNNSDLKEIRAVVHPGALSIVQAVQSVENKPKEEYLPLLDRLKIIQEQAIQDANKTHKTGGVTEQREKAQAEVEQLTKFPARVFASQKTKIEALEKLMLMQAYEHAYLSQIEISSTDPTQASLDRAQHRVEHQVENTQAYLGQLFTQKELDNKTNQSLQAIKNIVQPKKIQNQQELEQEKLMFDVLKAQEKVNSFGRHFRSSEAQNKLIEELNKAQVALSISENKDYREELELQRAQTDSEESDIKKPTPQKASSQVPQNLHALALISDVQLKAVKVLKSNVTRLEKELNGFSRHFRSPLAQEKLTAELYEARLKLQAAQKVANAQEITSLGLLSEVQLKALQVLRADVVRLEGEVNSFARHFRSTKTQNILEGELLLAQMRLGVAQKQREAIKDQQASAESPQSQAPSTRMPRFDSSKSIAFSDKNVHLMDFNILTPTHIGKTRTYGKFIEVPNSQHTDEFMDALIDKMQLINNGARPEFFRKNNKLYLQVDSETNSLTFDQDQLTRNASNTQYSNNALISAMQAIHYALETPAVLPLQTPPPALATTRPLIRPSVSQTQANITTQTPGQTQAQTRAQVRPSVAGAPVTPGLLQARDIQRPKPRLTSQPRKPTSAEPSAPSTDSPDNSAPNPDTFTKKP